eukprot:5468388-Pleurochrysis_carterae.AAC.3
MHIAYLAWAAKTNGLNYICPAGATCRVAFVPAEGKQRKLSSPGSGCRVRRPPAHYYNQV